jgi:transcriptional regulator with XRE-family HTH domain
MDTSRPEDLLSEAAASVVAGDIEGALAKAEIATSQLRRHVHKVPKTIDELMPLLRRKEAAGPVLRKFRQALGLTLMQTAEVCQVSPQFLGMIETGVKIMPQDAATRLVNYMAERGAKVIEEGPPPAALLKLRQALGFTQAAMAAKLGLKEAQVRRLETGNMPVSMPAAAAYRQLAEQRGLDHVLDQLAA